MMNHSNIPYDEWLDLVYEKALDVLAEAYPMKSRRELSDELSKNEHEEFVEEAKDTLGGAPPILKQKNKLLKIRKEKKCNCAIKLLLLRGCLCGGR